MPKERKKVLCMDAQRHAEYYGMQRTFDKLYAKSKAGETFTGLMELVLSPDNIMLAYRNIKANTGSYTAGTDKQNIGDIGRLPPAEVIGIGIPLYQKKKSMPLEPLSMIAVLS